MASPGGSLQLSLLLLLAAALTPCLAKEFVLTLTASNFDEEVKKHDFVVVEFYAPWCGHCKALAPEYEKAAKSLSEAGSTVVLAKVDADASGNKALAQRFGVQGFPTLKIFRKGDVDNPTEYKGPREAPGIVSFLQKQSGPASEELQSSKVVKDILDADSVLVVGVFSDADADAKAVFLEVADALRSEFSFRHTSDPSLLPVEHPQIKTTPVLRVLSTFDEGFADSTEFEVEALKKFVKSKSLPTVIEFSQDPKDRPFLNRVFETQDNKCMFFFDYAVPNAAELREAFTAVAKTRPDGMSFIVGEAAQNDHALKYFGLEAKETPAVVIHDPKGNGKYHRTNVDAKGVKDFIESFLAGTEEKKLKSEPVPEKNDGPVKVVVGKTFKELVLDSTKNVLIEFYAPWCGHCKKLEPIFKKVGEAFKNDPDILIAKLDYTANDISGEDFKVEGFPTIYFYTSTKQVIPYKGDRSKNDLITFVKQQKDLLQSNASQVDAEDEAEEAEAAAEELAESEGGKDEL